MPKNQYNKRQPASPPRVDLIPEEFHYLIEDHGCRVRITPAAICPVRSDKGYTEVGSTNHNLDCPLCDGRMIIDLDSEAYETWAFIQAIKIDRSFDQHSRFDIKDALMLAYEMERDLLTAYETAAKRTDLSLKVVLLLQDFTSHQVEAVGEYGDLIARAALTDDMLLFDKDLAQK